MSITSFDNTDAPSANRILGSLVKAHGSVVQYRATHGLLHIQLISPAGIKWHLHVTGCTVLQGETHGQWTLRIDAHPGGGIQVEEHDRAFSATGQDFVLTNRAPVVPIDSSVVLSIVAELAARSATIADGASGAREDILAAIAAIGSAIDSDRPEVREDVLAIVERLVRKHPQMSPTPAAMNRLQIGVY
jgi:hypothetical protein